MPTPYGGTLQEEDAVAGWWDEFYRAEHPYLEEPEPWLVDVLGSRGPGRALDLGAGTGRHSIWLAANGWSVVAVDSSSVAMTELGRHVRETDATIRAVTAELTEWDADGETFDAIIAAFVYQPSVFARLVRSLAPGGILVAVVHEASDHDRAQELAAALDGLARIELLESVRATSVARNAWTGEPEGHVRLIAHPV